MLRWSRWHHKVRRARRQALNGTRTWWMGECIQIYNSNIHERIAWTLTFGCVPHCCHMVYLHSSALQSATVKASHNVDSMTLYGVAQLCCLCSAVLKMLLLHLPCCLTNQASISTGFQDHSKLCACFEIAMATYISRPCSYVDLPKVNKKLLCAVSFEPPMQVRLAPTKQYFTYRGMTISMPQPTSQERHIHFCNIVIFFTLQCSIVVISQFYMILIECITS